MKISFNAFGSMTEARFCLMYLALPDNLDAMGVGVESRDSSESGTGVGESKDFSRSSDMDTSLVELEDLPSLSFLDPFVSFSFFFSFLSFF